jgi:hypothetical protein
VAGRFSNCGGLARSSRGDAERTLTD